MTDAPRPGRRQVLTAAVGGALLLAGCAGERVRTATLVDFLGTDRRPGDPLWSPEARAFVAAYPRSSLPTAKEAYTDDQYATVALGVVALWVVCPADQVEVGYCTTTAGFECPVCGSRYNGVGEQLEGPAVRGLDRYRVARDGDGQLVIDRSRRVDGPRRGTVTVTDDPTGPSTTRCAGSDLRRPTARRVSGA